MSGSEKIIPDPDPRPAQKVLDPTGSGLTTQDPTLT
jgi:hypothetical protein